MPSPRPSGRLITLGEALLCLAPTQPVAFEAAHDYRAHLAGAELNTAIAIRRLGLPAVFITRLGDDGPGRILRHAMAANGIQVQSLEIDPDRTTGLYLREWLPDGQRRLSYYRRESAATVLGSSGLALPTLTGTDVALLTGITVSLGTAPRSACEQLIDAARGVGATTCFDPNYRPLLWGSERAARTVLLRMIRLVDGVLLSEDDAELLFGSTDPDVVISASLALGPRTVVFKQGERGACVATDAGIRFHQPADAVTSLVDPVGAGDGFNGGFLAGLLVGLDLHEAARLGSYVGARAVEVMGDSAGYPILEEIPDDLRRLLDHRRPATTSIQTT